MDVTFVWALDIIEFFKLEMIRFIDIFLIEMDL